MKSSEGALWLETVVCSARKGVDARLERMLEASINEKKDGWMY